jgi:hypothetical protein
MVRAASYWHDPLHDNCVEPGGDTAYIGGMKNLAARKGKFRIQIFQSLGVLAMLSVVPQMMWASEPQKIAMTADHWEAKGDVEFLHSDGSGGPAGDVIKVTKGYALLKDFTFHDGTIELDTQPIGNMGAGVAFRYRDKDTYEDFYLRPQPKCDQAAGCIQYAPHTKGVLLWDVYPQFQGPAPLKDGAAWNHIRLVISGKRMNVYVNGATQPSLQIGHLEGDVMEGGIFLQGPGTFANLVVTPGATDGLKPEPEPDPSINNKRLVRNWQLSAWSTLEAGKDPAYSDVPASGWVPIEAERGGLVNISRVDGLPTDRKTRTMAWLKTTIVSEKAQTKKVDFGWVREAWVFVNGKLVYCDKNMYMPAEARKKPDGRLSLENGSFDLPLQAGKNEITIALATQFYGWGIKMQLADLKGVKLAGVGGEMTARK